MTATSQRFEATHSVSLQRRCYPGRAHSSARSRIERPDPAPFCDADDSQQESRDPLLSAQVLPLQRPLSRISDSNTIRYIYATHFWYRTLVGHRGTEAQRNGWLLALGIPSQDELTNPWPRSAELRRVAGAAEMSSIGMSPDRSSRFPVRSPCLCVSVAAIDIKSPRSPSSSPMLRRRSERPCASTAFRARGTRTRRETSGASTAAGRWRRRRRGRASCRRWRP